MLVKHAYGDDQAKLRRESETLTALKHLPGVVETQGLIELEDRSELAITYVEGAPLVEHPPFGVDLLLDIVLSVARTLVAVHELGIAHGAINREHVLIDRRGRVILCGFGAAGRQGTAGCPEVGDDVRALASLLTFELERSEEAGLARAHRREAAEAAAAAARLSSDPTGASLARWIAQLDTSLRSARAISSGPASPSARRTSGAHSGGLVGRLKAVTRTQWIAAAIVVVAAFVFYQTFKPSGQPAVAGEPAGASADVAAPTVSAPTVPVVGPDTTTSGAQVEPTVPAGPSAQPGLVDGAGTLVFAAGCPPEVAPDLTELGPEGSSATFDVHVDGDGCVDQVFLGVSQTTGRPLVVTSANRWEVGEPGDLLTLGDWNCDGVATVAALRPSTGGVFTFGVWPGSGSVTPTFTAQVPVDATALATLPASVELASPQACDQLSVSIGETSFMLRLDSGSALLVAR